MKDSGKWCLGLALVALVTLSGCVFTIVPGTPAAASLYAVDSINGNIYEVDRSMGLAATVPLVSIGQNASGEIAFGAGYGFVAVASYNNTAPGLYRFDPDYPALGASRIGGAMSAQYLCIVSSWKGYVTVADYSASANDGLYSFNPSSISSGLTKVCALSYPQDVALGSDGRIYVAENGTGQVVRLNATGDAIEAKISATALGTTGLLAGRYLGKNGIFVANTGGYDQSWNALPGSLDFVAFDAINGSTAQSVVAGLTCARLAAFDTSTLVATGGYPAKTRKIMIESNGSTTMTEVLADLASFGSMDVAVIDGVAYVPDGSNGVYSFTKDLNDVAKISVGKSGEMIVNVGVSE